MNYKSVLTDKEEAVLHALMRGVAQKHIALEMGLAPKSVHGILRDIRLKLHADTTIQAVARYLGWGE